MRRKRKSWIRRHRLFILVVVAVLGLTSAAYAWDRSRDDLIASGVTIAGVNVEGMRTTEAEEVLSRELVRPSKRPVRVLYKGQVFRLTPKRARLRIDTAGTVQAALERSRQGGLVERTWRAVSGGSVDTDLPMKLSYSKRRVRRWVKQIESEINRPAEDATVSFSGTGLQKVPSHNGLALETSRLIRGVQEQLDRVGRRHSVKATAKVTKPDVTIAQLADKYPTVITVNRTGFKVGLWRRLKLVRSYTIAVGQAGFDSPAGQFSIITKQVNPTWYVPDKPWAGKLRGKVIPPGPDNPLKARWLGVTGDGVGFHGTDAVGTLGTRASHGCFRMSVPDVKQLYREVSVGTPVFIS